MTRQMLFSGGGTDGCVAHLELPTQEEEPSRRIFLTIFTGSIGSIKTQEEGGLAGICGITQ